MSYRLEKVLAYKINTFNSLYVLCDYETLIKKQLTLKDFIILCNKSDVKLIQYRDKISSIDKQKENLIYLKKSLDIPIIINDKLELIDYVDGLHLGQEDLLLINKNKKLAINFVRNKIKNKLLGLSTHNETEILESNEFDIDMIGLGAYRDTSTKKVSQILGDKIINLAKLSKYPVCAIGGVKKNDKINAIDFNVVGSAFYD